MTAIVYLIGTGPGHPDLIAARGLRCLAQADVVIYDHHVHPRLLRHARQDAEKIDVGPAGAQPLAQEAICYLLAEKVREGHRVARLKWGAPSLLDGGSVEALFLHENNVPFEVVPSVSPAVAAAIYAGVPLTPPGGGTVTFVEGGGDASSKSIDWLHLAQLEGTIACSGTADELPLMLDSLLKHGRSPEDAAALVYDPALASQTARVGTLGGLSSELIQSPDRRSGFAIIGKGAALRDHLRWFDARPLFGRRVLVTRSTDQAGDLVERLETAGADVIEAPMIRILPPEDAAPLDDACARVRRFDWIIFASANAVEHFIGRLLATPFDLRALGSARLCAVGPVTAAALRRYGLKVDIVPHEFRAEAVVESLAASGDLEGSRVLIPRADIGRDVVASALRQQGADVTDVVAYRTVAIDPERDGGPDIYRMLLERQVDAVAFTSPSAVRNFVKVLGDEPAADLMRTVVAACIGPLTSEAAAEHRIQATVQPAEYTVPALVDALIRHFSTGAP